MTPSSISATLTSTLREDYQRASNALRDSFSESQDGVALVNGRSDLVDNLIERLWLEHIAAEEYGPQGLTLAAIGGYGRRQLFPYSDVDLLFVCAEASQESGFQVAIRRLAQELWDIGLRVSATTRTVEECERLSEENPEFTLSLLDRRYITGDFALFEELDATRIPGLIARRRPQLLGAIAELSRARHAKFQHTLFHLEPNVKDGPGGLRDFHTCGWLSQLLPDPARNSTRYESNLMMERRDESELAYRFLLNVRGFLHFRGQRDDNMLYWQAQDQVAERHLGLSEIHPVEAAQWMRQYFRHARSIDWVTRQMLDETQLSRSRPRIQGSFLDSIRQRRNRTALAGCAVKDGRIWLESVGEYSDPERVLTIFEHLAEQQPLQLSREAEGHLSESLAILAEQLPEGAAIWSRFARILLGAEAAACLRTMHALGILELILPEFHGVDALVVRDAYHRYTVDEHTFLIIEHLHALDRPATEWESHFREILEELEEPSLLYLAGLLHDTGKARSEENHSEQSLLIANGIVHRWHLAPAQRDTVLRLIRNHLEMSRALRKDIFDAETIRAFAELVGTPDDLRLLTLLTYADIHSVNPEALTPWKAENLWRLYMATSNYLDRNVDEDRIAVDADTAAVQKVTALAPEQSPEIHQFLAGLPQRYLRTRAPQEILGHWRSAAALSSSSAQVSLVQAGAWWECTIVTRDRPFLFADLAGALTGWGMDIIKADAFSNAAGVVVDTFRFLDRYRTLSLNPGEVVRCRQSVGDVAAAKISVEPMLAARAHALASRNSKTRVQTRLSVDNASSTHSTILQVIAQDTPGLLRRISLVMAQQNCDISVALIDTEGEMAIDVFYLTSSSPSGRLAEASEQAKLDAGHAERLQDAVTAALL